MIALSSAGMLYFRDMKKNVVLQLLFACLCGQVAAQPGSVNMTPVQNLTLQRVKMEVSAKYTTLIDTSKTYVNLPKGYQAKLFYVGGLLKPRSLAFHNGLLYVSDMSSSAGRIRALPDLNNDGYADTSITVASGFSNNHDVLFYKGSMYVTESARVNKLNDTDGNGVYETRSTFISGIGTGGHVTRTLVFDSINGKAYLSIGSSCNVCRESNRAIIEQYNEDGSGKRTYATGVRNAVGMALHPSTNHLWANNNGSDNQGNETPPEWTDIIRENGFYGHPFAYANQVWFDFENGPNDYKNLRPITASDSANVSKMIEPAALIRAHQAPMELCFLNNTFPSQFNKGFLMALRGSWNAPGNHRGYKLVYMDLSNDTDTTVNFVADFCTGFLTDSVNKTFWGRPVGIALDQKGRIFVSSDEGNNFIFMIYPVPGVGISESKTIESVWVYPNPARSELHFSFELRTAASIHIRLYDLSGKLIKEIGPNAFAAGNYTQDLDMAELSRGIYFYELSNGVQSSRGKVVVEK